MIGLMVDLLWKNTVAKLDRYVGYFDEHIEDALKYLKQKFKEFQINHETKVSELKDQIHKLKEQNINQVK